MSRRIYLGRRVKDIGKKGLSHKKEFDKIIEKIVQDYKRGKITRKRAMGRLLLLYRLTYKKNNSNLRISAKTCGKIRRKISKTMSGL